MNKKPTMVISIIVISAIILVFGYLSYKYQTKKYQEKTAQSSQSVPAVSDSGIFNIDIRGFVFNPSSLVINAGDTVTWTNNDPVPHKIAGDGFGSDSLNKGSTYTFKFVSVGTYNYHCAIHPSMTATIIVK